MRVAVEKLDGVTSAEVSLNEGEVVVALEGENHVRLDRLRQVIRDQGFTPREAEIRARGVVERRDGRLFFRTPEGEVVLEVIGDPVALEAAEGRVGQPVVVRGHVDEGAFGRIRVVEVAAAVGMRRVPTRSGAVASPPASRTSWTRDSSGRRRLAISWWRSDPLAPGSRARIQPSATRLALQP